jgi:hypothetical protein
MTIEFLPSDEAPEQLPGPPATPSRRWWWLVAAAVVVAAAAYLLTRPAAPRNPPPPRSGPVAGCRGVPNCAVRDRVPAKIARLALAELPPGARLRVRSVVSVDSITHEELLVARTVTATTEWITVTIQISRGSDILRQPVLNPLNFRSVSLHGVNSGFVVRLRYVAPASLPPRLAELQALIHDPRLSTSS